MPTSASKSPGRIFDGMSKAWAPATLDVLEAAAGGSPEVVGPLGESLFAAHGRLLAVHTLVAPPKANRVVVGPVVDAVDTVLDWDRQLPHVGVAIDRQGGDIDGTGVARSTMRAVTLKWSSPSQPLKVASTSEALAGDEDAFEMSAAATTCCGTQRRGVLQDSRGQERTGRMRSHPALPVG
ncbi:hypothetical protein [Streptomyces aureus]|uniref:hypothetical protein n=1 Tax=Streptomyces aureus TaxID=193461 RepID=UPI0036C8BBF5